MEEERKLPRQMRIGEFSRVSGVRRETIHYYIREGLLPPAEKKNARVSYFGSEHLERLLLIRRMRQAHLPLSVIREQLEAAELLPMERLVPRYLEFLSLDGDEPELSVDSVAEHARLTVGQVKQLEALGVLRPAKDEGRALYTQADADAAAAARLLLDQGVELDSLRFVSRYSELAEQELGFIYHHLISPAIEAGRRNEVSGGLGMQALQLIEGYLRRQVRREIGLFGRAVFSLADPLDQESASDR